MTCGGVQEEDALVDPAEPKGFPSLCHRHSIVLRGEHYQLSKRKRGGENELTFAAAFISFLQPFPFA